VAKVAFLFPGQGSAAVGMGDAIASASAAARQVMHRFRALLPEVYAVCARGPTDQLIRTANAQPAIFAVDCACLAALDERNVRPDVVAGHSLGEYAALVAASVVDFETGLRLVIERASLMEKATAARPGKMLAVLGLGVGQVATIVGAWADRGIIANANDNAPGQIIVSGDASTLDAAAADFRASGARVMELPVGGAFHSALMREAEDVFVATLEAAPFADARIPLISNLTAAASQDAATLKSALRAQITGSVRWRQSIDTMLADGANTFVEVGPGRILSGLVQRCTRDRSVRILNVEDPDSLERTAQALGAARHEE